MRCILRHIKFALKGLDIARRKDRDLAWRAQSPAGYGTMIRRGPAHLPAYGGGWIVPSVRRWSLQIGGTPMAQEFVCHASQALKCHSMASHTVGASGEVHSTRWRTCGAASPELEEHGARSRYFHSPGLPGQSAYHRRLSHTYNRVATFLKIDARGHVRLTSIRGTPRSK